MSQKLHAHQHEESAVDKLVRLARHTPSSIALPSYGEELEAAINDAEPKDGLKLFEALLSRFVSGYTDSKVEYESSLRRAKKVILLAYANRAVPAAEAHAHIEQLVFQKIGSNGSHINEYIAPYAQRFVALIDRYSHREPVEPKLFPAPLTPIPDLDRVKSTRNGLIP